MLVKDAVRTKQEFGPYVKPVQGDANNGESLKKVMKGAKSVVICGAVGQSVRAAAALGLEHVVLPSALGMPSHELHVPHHLPRSTDWPLFSLLYHPRA